MGQKTYNIHNFVDLVLHTTIRGYVKYFDNEYLRVSSLADPHGKARTRITVHIVRKLPHVLEGDIRRTVRFKRLFTHSFVVRNLHTEDVHLFFKHHPIGSVYATAVGVFLQGQVLEPLIYLKLLEQDVLLMHAAGVADGRSAYLFAAEGGTGKTSLSLGLLDEGFTLLGDDLLLVAPWTGEVFAYPRPLHLFRYNLGTVTGGKVPRWVQLTIRAKDIVRFFLERLTGEAFLIATRVHADKIYQGIEFPRSANYKKLYLLARRGAAETIPLLNSETQESIANQIIHLADINKSLRENILDDSSSAEARQRELQVTRQIIDRLPEVRRVNTRRLDLSDLSDFADELRS